MGNSGEDRRETAVDVSDGADGDHRQREDNASGRFPVHRRLPLSPSREWNDRARPMMNDKSLNGKLALVTGASRGIGAATAEALAEVGAHVILVARTASALEEIEERIHEAGGSATIAPLDLTDGENIGKLAGAV